MNFIGRTVGQYKVVEAVGQGGMASVFKAYQPVLDRFVAIKILLTRHALADGFAKRFLREARAIAQLNHPNVLPILDFGQEQDFSYIVTKLVTGGTLKQRLGRAMSLAEAACIIEQVASALDHAHERGILHRDIKPSNILLDEDDWVQLADFGLAKMLAGDGSPTASGVGIGTPAYMSPEQGQGLGVDHRTDIYSLGVILYEMVTGRLPYSAETPMAIIFKHVYEPLTLPRLVRREIPPLVEAVILKTMEKKPEDRYATANEMAEALHEAVKISASDAGIVVKSLRATAEDLSTQPTLTWDKEEIETVLAPDETTSPEDALLAEITPPPEPLRPPEVARFVGRETELGYLEEKLRSLNLAVITGMAGVGKTALASQVAKRSWDPEKTFWHSFHENEGVEVILWRLAGFLFWRGQKDLWHKLQGAQYGVGQTPPTEVLLDYLFEMIRGQGYLLCLDDLHCAEATPLLTELIQRLYQSVVTGRLSLIITSRRALDIVSATEFEPLKGLSGCDAEALLATRSLSLPSDLADDLYAQTEGNPQLLTLAIEALKQTSHSKRTIAHLVETEDIERYLITEVDAGLTEEERDVMGAVAVLLGYPGTRNAIETILDSGSVRRILGDLSRRHLLDVSLGKWGREYKQLAIIRTFYHDLLGRRKRRVMHRRAGRFYETEEPDVLKALIHYEQAGESEKTTALET